MKRFNIGHITAIATILLALIVAVVALHSCVPPVEGAQLPIATTTSVVITPSSVLPIGANGDWTTDLSIRNKSNETVTQKLGHLTFTRAGFDPIVLESTITLKPGETRRFKNVEAMYDSGLYVLQVDPRLDASAFLSFRGNVARFDLEALGKSLSNAGENAMFYRVAIDPASNINTFPLILNPSSVPTQVEFILFGPDGSTKLADVFATAAPGVSEFTLPAIAKDGGSLKICHTVCGVGVPSNGGVIYPAVIVGPDNGGTQSPRYAQ